MNKMQEQKCTISFLRWYSDNECLLLFFSEGKVVTCVCVFTLSCFLAKCSYVFRREREKYKVEMFL